LCRFSRSNSAKCWTWNKFLRLQASCCPTNWNSSDSLKLNDRNPRPGKNQIHYSESHAPRDTLLARTFASEVS
jgi:hypothetical protein